MTPCERFEDALLQGQPAAADLAHADGCTRCAVMLAAVSQRDPLGLDAPVTTEERRAAAQMTTAVLHHRRRSRQVRWAVLAATVTLVAAAGAVVSSRSSVSGRRLEGAPACVRERQPRREVCVDGSAWLSVTSVELSSGVATVDTEVPVDVLVGDQRVRIVRGWAEVRVTRGSVASVWASVNAQVETDGLVVQRVDRGGPETTPRSAAASPGEVLPEPNAPHVRPELDGPEKDSAPLRTTDATQRAQNEDGPAPGTAPLRTTDATQRVRNEDGPARGTAPLRTTDATQRARNEDGPARGTAPLRTTDATQRARNEDGPAPGMAPPGTSDTTQRTRPDGNGPVPSVAQRTRAEVNGAAPGAAPLQTPDVARSGPALPRRDAGVTAVTDAQVEALLRRAREARRDGDLDGALRLYEQVLTLDARPAARQFALVSMGGLHLAAGRADAACAAYTRASAMGGGGLDREALLGEIACLERLDPARARAAAEAFRRRFPDDPAATTLESRP